MLGIVSYGAYIPWHRLSREEIGRAWGTPVPPGEKAVASYDEDSLTMAVAAAINCLDSLDAKTLDCVYFASTTFPYKEKQNATTLATVLDIDKTAFTLDISNSLRGGTCAIKLAMDALKGGSANRVLVCTADMRTGYPNGEMELSLSDGAAALIIGDSNVIAEIEGYQTIHNELIDIWRSDKDKYVKFWEDRFLREEGYGKVVTNAVSVFLKDLGLTSKDFAKAIFNAPEVRQLDMIAKNLNFDPKSQVQKSILGTLGNTGTALTSMSLVAALEEANPGDRILVTSYGDGCDVLALRVTDQIKNLNKRLGIKSQIEIKKMMRSYETYLRWREIIETEPAKRPPMEVPSAVALWRDTIGGLALYGVKCKNCGTPQYPAQRVCVKCHSKDEFEDYCFADKKGIISAFSHDKLGLSVDPPITTTSVDFSEGGRIMCDMTDRDPDEVKVGMTVDMTFRKLRYTGSIYDYWWKCKPARNK